MIDLVYQTLLTIINKENQGYVSPTEFNILAHTIQLEIFRGYLEDSNRDQNRENRGLTNRGIGNLDFTNRQRLRPFMASDTLTITNGVGIAPADFYMLVDKSGMMTGANETYPARVIDEVDPSQIGYMNLTSVAPTELYPIYEMVQEGLKVYPITIGEVDIRYIRTPQQPNWTYQLVGNQPLFDPSNGSYQDFELVQDEFTNIVLRMLTHFGINLREREVVEAAELLKQQKNVKEDS